MATRRLRILVGDENPFICTAYKRILETQPGFEVVGSAVDGEEALQKGIVLAPDVVVFDVRMPRLDGIEASHRLLTHHPDTGVVIVSAYDDLEYLRELIRFGPESKAYLLKDTLYDITELINVVEGVADGGTYIDNSIVHKIARLYVRQSRFLRAELTETEEKVLELMAEGLNSSTFSDTLHLDQHSIESHMASVNDKLGLPSAAALSQEAVLTFVRQSVSDPSFLDIQRGA